MTARTQTLPASKWPWLDHRVSAALAAAMSALLLGILTFAAVGQMAKQCSREPIYRVTSGGALRVTAQGSARVVNGKRLECRRMSWQLIWSEEMEPMVRQVTKPEVDQNRESATAEKPIEAPEKVESEPIANDTKTSVSVPERSALNKVERGDEIYALYTSPMGRAALGRLLSGNKVPA